MRSSRRYIVNIYKRLYCRKVPIDSGNVPPKDPDKIEGPVGAVNIHSDEYDTFQERALQQVVIEKEQDANFQSGLSKSCKILFSGSENKTVSIKYDPSIRLGPMASGKDHKTSNDESIPRMNEIWSLDPTITKFAESSIQSTVKSNVDESDYDGSRSGNLVSFRRPNRQEPGKVLLAFIPEQWWRAFIPTTGVTGFGTFLFAFGTFLVSKEFYVIEHYFYHGCSSLILWAMGIKYCGPIVSNWLDTELDKYEKMWNAGRVQEKEILKEGIMNELQLQYQIEGQLMLIDVKRENVLLQLEEEYRKRKKYACQEIKKRLDYHVNIELVRKRIQHKNLIEYVTNEVVKSITPEMQNKLIYYSIDRIVQDIGEEGHEK